MKKIFLSVTFVISVITLSSCDGGGKVKSSPVFGDVPGLLAKYAKESYQQKGELSSDIEKDKQAKEEVTNAFKELNGKEIPCKVEDGAPVELDGTLKITETNLDKGELVFGGCKLVTTSDIVYNDKSSFGDNKDFVFIFVDEQGIPLFYASYKIRPKLRTTYEPNEVVASGKSFDVKFSENLLLSFFKPEPYIKAAEVVVAFVPTSKLYRRLKDKKKRE